MNSSLPKVRSREITDSDVSRVIDLLVQEYDGRSRDFWVRSLDRLARHTTPAGLPKYGYVMESNGALVGAILLIFSSMQSENGPTLRCSIGGWCVEPAFRGFAPLLVSQALRRKDVTYMNVPGPSILPIVKAQGFSPYASGQFAAIPALSSKASDLRVKVIEAGTRPDAHFEPYEHDLLLAHMEFGCISLWCVTAERAYPFVFHPRNVKGFLPCARLVYCRSIDDFVRFARPIGWHPAMRMRPLVLLDANGPIPGLLGKYFEGSRPKYFKGPTPPRLGDLAYTQLSMFETTGRTS